MSNLKRIWTGMLTSEGRWDGSRSRTVLIINERGTDKLHHTFPKGNPPHQGRGEANLYEIDVTANEIDTERLNTSSVRVGLRGQDYWRPQHVLVWGELADDNTIVPLAAEQDLSVKVSHDPKEGPISFPLRPIGAGTDDMLITHLILMTKTSDVKNAETNNAIDLSIMNGQNVLLDYKILDTTQNGQTNFSIIPVENSFSKTMLQADSIHLGNKDFNAWIPESFFLFGFNENASRSKSYVPLVHLPEWSVGWLSSDEIDNAQSSVILPLFGQDDLLNETLEVTEEVTGVGSLPVDGVEDLSDTSGVVSTVIEQVDTVIKEISNVGSLNGVEDLSDTSGTVSSIIQEANNIILNSSSLDGANGLSTISTVTEQVSKVDSLNGVEDLSNSLGSISNIDQQMPTLDKLVNLEESLTSEDQVKIIERSKLLAI